ncbi:MAG TPA: hypothetical protein VKH18_16695 [Terriglobales bacterium]|nr:hypothetical protein [Terriglobales bacterium]
MRRKIEMAVLAVVLIVVGITPGIVVAQVSLLDQLSAQYKLAKMGSDTGGYSVVEAGTLLAIQKGGILGVPYSDKTVLTTKYEGGTVHTPSSVAVQARKALFGHFSQTASEGQTTHLFAKGDKVYPTKIDVNLAKDNVTLSIVACDTCNKTDPPTYNKAQVVFQFPAGTLANASAGQVEDIIGQLLSISSDDAQGGDQGGGQQGGDQQGNNQQGGDQGAQAQQQAPVAEPAQIEKGQTPDQVKAALGNPDKIINLGTKLIYVYKDIKVTFLNGKVSDVQ